MLDVDERARRKGVLGWISSRSMPFAMAFGSAIGITILLSSGSAANAQIYDDRIETFKIDAPLPRSNNYKMVDGDVAKLVLRLCDLGVNQKKAACSVWVQPDNEGTLIGYLTIVTEDDGGTFYRSDTVTRDRRPCFIGGSLEQITPIDPPGFKARSQFSVKEAIGMIYFKREGNHLEINDERWNYCYQTTHISDVWYLLGTQNR